MIREIERKPPSGYVAVVLLFTATAWTSTSLVRSARVEDALMAVIWAVALAAVLVLWFGLFVVHPNEAKVLQLFGRYVGTVRDPGLKYANPFYTRRRSRYGCAISRPRS